MVLKDFSIRNKTGDTADNVIARLRPKTSNKPGTLFTMQSYQELRIGGRSSAAQYQYTLTADTTQDLDTWGPLLLKEAQSLPEIKDVQTDQQDAGLETYVDIDRDTASRLGITPLAIDSALSDAYGPAPGLHHLPPAQPVPRRHGSRAAVPAIAGRPPHPLREVLERDAGAALRHQQTLHAARSAQRQPSGPVARLNALVQPHARGFAGRGHHRH